MGNADVTPRSADIRQKANTNASNVAGVTSDAIASAALRFLPETFLILGPTFSLMRTIISNVLKRLHFAVYQ